MSDVFSNVEIADVHLIYTERHRNSNKAWKVYMERFIGHRTPM